MIFGFLLLFVGLPASIITTIVFAVKKKKVRIPAICIPASFILSLVFFVSGANIYSQTDEYKELAEQQRIEREQEEEKERIAKEAEENQEEEEIAKTKKDSKEGEANGKKPKESEKPKEPVETIFYGEIGLNEELYKGKEVAFSFKCGYVYDDEVEEAETESNLCYGSVKVQFKEKQNISEVEYITVSGTIEEDHSATVLMDAVIIAKGKEAENNYNRELETFKQSFMNAETASYENLLRYPDTYKNQKIKIKLDITDVETDGMIFNGTIKGTVPETNNEIALYDYRENREPRMQEGDKLIVYGVGNKTVTVKVKNGKGLFAETVDEYDIPCLYVQYIEFR